MKKVFTLAIILLFSGRINSQENYCDFEGIKKIHFGERTGVLDTVVANPAPTSLNSSSMCAKYIRDTATYDNFKMYTPNKLIDVTPYATNAGSPPKITMKVLTSAPVGTKIDIQLGAKSNTAYPAGIHSEYTAVTQQQNTWHTLTFSFYQMPSGSAVAATDVNKIVVLFRPNSNARDTLYFDDPTGPETIPLGLFENSKDASSAKLLQNQPNPSKENTTIPLILNSNGHIRLDLYNVLGKHISTLADEDMTAGKHSVQLNTEQLPGGIYFYVLKKGNYSVTKKLTVTK